MAVIIALALMTGVQGELRDRIVGSEAHIYVYKIGQPFLDVDAELKKLMIPGVAGGAPAIRGLGLLTSSTVGRPEPRGSQGHRPGARVEGHGHRIGRRERPARRPGQPRNQPARRNRPRQGSRREARRRGGGHLT